MYVIGEIVFFKEWLQLIIFTSTVLTLDSYMVSYISVGCKICLTA